MAETTETLYQIADAEIRLCIKAYLELAKATKSLAEIHPEHLKDKRARVILLAGLGARKLDSSAAQAVEEWRRRQAIPFDLEAGITAGYTATFARVVFGSWTRLKKLRGISPGSMLHS
jgi:hypothetical protein